jgi:diaminopimelate decarboxylase
MTSSITPLRISLGVIPDTHLSIATGHSRSKFALPGGATATDRLTERIPARGSVRLRGIHIHLGSQIRDLRVYETAVRTIAPYLRAWDLPELCVGDGLAVAHTARETAPSITEFAETVRRACADTPPALRLTCEPPGPAGRRVRLRRPRHHRASP